MANCPTCGGEFAIENQRGVSVAVCSKCGGIWLAAGDLDRLSGEELEHEFDAWMSPPTECRYCNTPLGFSDTCISCQRLPTIQCPAGHGVMDAAIVEVADREFEIDRCASCRGVWVDGHEREHVDAVAGPPVRKLPPRKHQSGGRPAHPESSILEVMTWGSRPRGRLARWRDRQHRMGPLELVFFVVVIVMSLLGVGSGSVSFSFLRFLF